MRNKKYMLYDVLADRVRSSTVISSACSGEVWAGVETPESFGIAMSTAGDSIKRMFPEFDGLSLSDAAQAVKSWNLSEASLGLAAINAYYNTTDRLSELGCEIGLDARVIDGLDFSGKTVGVIGHMHVCDAMWEKAKTVYRLERAPKDGDYPDPACDYLLPECDIVVITGSSIINKTLPHLLELCPDALKILTGPSVPMCPELLELGIDRLAGMVVTDKEGMQRFTLSNIHGSPLKFCRTFMLARR